MTGGAPARAEDSVPGSRYTSVRAAAMGDAYLPVGDDGASGLFYNPADIGKIRSTQFEPLNASLLGNSGVMSTFQLNSYKVPSLSGFAPALEAHPGTFVESGASYLPTVYTKGFAFGVLIQSQIGAQANPDGSLHYRSSYQLIPTLGTGVRLGGGILRLGYSLQWVNEAVGDLTVPSSASPLGYNQGLSQGSGFSHNVGAALSLPVMMLPSLNLVARNILGTKYGTSSLLSFSPTSTGAPATEPMTFDGSLSIQPKLGNGQYANIVFEYRDMTNTSQISPWGRAALGVEYSVRDAFFIRGGWGEGYPDIGFGVKSRSSEFSFAWSSVEIGGGYHVDRDIQYLIQYQVRLF